LKRTNFLSHLLIREHQAVDEVREASFVNQEVQRNKYGLLVTARSHASVGTELHGVITASC
jgi:hypothetical protein